MRTATSISSLGRHRPAKRQQSELRLPRAVKAKARSAQLSPKCRRRQLPTTRTRTREPRQDPSRPSSCLRNTLAPVFNKQLCRHHRSPCCSRPFAGPVRPFMPGPPFPEHRRGNTPPRLLLLPPTTLARGRHRPHRKKKFSRRASSVASRRAGYSAKAGSRPRRRPRSSCGVSPPPVRKRRTRPRARHMPKNVERRSLVRGRASRNRAGANAFTTGSDCRIGPPRPRTKVRCTPSTSSSRAPAATSPSVSDSSTSSGARARRPDGR